MSNVYVDVTVHQGNMPKKGKVADMFEAFESLHAWTDANGATKALGNKDTIQVRRHQFGYSFLLNDTTPVRLDSEFAIVETELPPTTGTLVMEWLRKESSKRGKATSRPVPVEDISSTSAARETMSGQPKPESGIPQAGFDFSSGANAQWSNDTHMANLQWMSGDEIKRASNIYPDDLFIKVMGTLVEYLARATCEMPVMVELDGGSHGIDPERVMAIIDVGGMGYLVRIDTVGDSVFVVADGQATLPSGTVKFIIESVAELDSAERKPVSMMRAVTIRQRDFNCMATVNGEHVSNRVVDSIVTGFVDNPFVDLTAVDRLEIGYNHEQDVAFVEAYDKNNREIDTGFIYINEGGAFVKLEPVRPGRSIPMPSVITVTGLNFHWKLLEGRDRNDREQRYGGKHHSPAFGRGQSHDNRGSDTPRQAVPTREWIPQLNQSVYLEDDPKQELYYISDFDQYEKKFIIVLADSLRAMRKRSQAEDGVGTSQLTVDPARLRPFVLFY